MNFDKVTKCIVHANCPDGILSAILLRDALPKAEIQFVQYGTAEYKALKPEPGVLYADFSPPVRSIPVVFSGTGTRYVVLPEDVVLLQAYVDAGTIVLDHHATAKPVVEAFGENGRFGDEKAQPGVCGASLVHRYIWTAPGSYGEDQRVEDLVLLAGIRDTWQRQSPRWRSACAKAAVLMFFPWEHWLKTSINEAVKEVLGPLGETLLVKRELEVAEAAEKAYRFTSSKGTRVVVFEGVSLSSDVAELVHDRADLVVGFGYEVSTQCGCGRIDCEELLPRIRLSTRSHTSFDCAAFAKAHGGGGHTKAAGFNLDVHPSDKNPYEYVRELVATWEVLQ